MHESQILERDITRLKQNTSKETCASKISVESKKKFDNRPGAAAELNTLLKLVEAENKDSTYHVSGRIKSGKTKGPSGGGPGRGRGAAGAGGGARGPVEQTKTGCSFPNARPRRISISRRQRPAGPPRGRRKRRALETKSGRQKNFDNEP
ncbi:hypothetical protein EVAR_67309_1 [Eumeta japonica]|uniref:Uncharacterized protein n=1 Tax=Eumeta variegata TaxID=151549 RepID=A0A4C1Z7E9_EUMVA|nr:hypothetical protein EVAR_67309_1 [Eumeta japonica]